MAFFLKLNFVIVLKPMYQVLKLLVLINPLPQNLQKQSLSR